ncbi:hypothetical protein [Streptomyces minutiscleroticus]|uniref:hypothetical protein n=1 Tax=Streptomyces minutiscleroticus TaxID=68238 RepID=UPI00167CE222|nr:hypothetical protein [Streptomyces minutiscleroticus]
MARPSQYPLELRRRAVRMVAEVRPDHDAEWAAMKAVLIKFGSLDRPGRGGSLCCTVGRH